MSEAIKVKIFLTALAAIFLIPLGYFAWQARTESHWMEKLQREVQQVPRQPRGGLCLLTGSLISPSGTAIKSAQSGKPCVAFAVQAVLVTLSADGDQIFTDLPVYSKQVGDLQLRWNGQSFPLQLGQADLGLWLSNEKLGTHQNYLSSSLPSYLPESNALPYKGVETLDYELSEYVLTEGGEVTVLAEVDSSGALAAGEYPIIIYPGKEKQFLTAHAAFVKDRADNKAMMFMAVGFVVAMFGFIALAIRLTTRASQAGEDPPLWVRLFLLAIVLLVLAAGAVLPGYLDSAG